MDIPSALLVGLDILFFSMIVPKIQNTKHVVFYSFLVVVFFVALLPFIHLEANPELPWRLLFGFLNGVVVLAVGNYLFRIKNKQKT
jgi:heme/copper-type cytochrome/quinol oxidase subunit 4